MQAYSDSEREDNPYALPDIEIFELTDAETIGEEEAWEASKRFPLAHMNSRERDKAIDWAIAQGYGNGGWYWQACFPGCPPDSDPIGPFASYAEALADAQEGMEE